MGVAFRRYIDILTIIINFPYSTCISSFLGQQHPYVFVHFLNVFSVLYNNNPELQKAASHDQYRTHSETIKEGAHK